MDKIKFINSRFEAQWGYQLNDGRIIEVMRPDGKLAISFSTPFNLETGEIREIGEYRPWRFDNEIPDDVPKGFTTLNNLIAQGNGHRVFCYDEYDIDLGNRPKMGEKKIEAIIEEFNEHGFNVTKSAILHNYYAWSADLKSGYRDERNGYHLFSPCGCNPFSLRATTLHEFCSDWQTTYEA